LASTDLVEKLSLPTRPHPHPYRIQWLNQGGSLKVTRSVRVHFSMGSYHDYADCDIVPMETCSLLLVGLGNMIQIACIMVAQTITLSCLRARKSFFTP
jgi:hypothetical protein